MKCFPAFIDENVEVNPWYIYECVPLLKNLPTTQESANSILKVKTDRCSEDSWEELKKTQHAQVYVSNLVWGAYMPLLLRRGTDDFYKHSFSRVLYIMVKSESRLPFTWYYRRNLKLVFIYWAMILSNWQSFEKWRYKFVSH